MNYTVLLSLFSSLGFIAASLKLVLNWRGTGLTLNVCLPLVSSMLLCAFVAISNTLEHSGLTAYFDPAEDVAEILFPLVLIFFANNWRQQKSLEDFREQEAWLRVTLESINDGIVTTDRQGRIRQMNKAMENLTGWSFTEAAGKPLAGVLHLLRSDSREPCPCPAEQVLTVGTICAVEKDLILLARNGDEYRVADSGAPIRNSLGEVSGAVLVFHDVTEEFLREMQLNQSRKLEAVGQLAGGVAHDFNNMLGGIVGSAEILARHLGQEHPLQKHIATILKARENAASLIRKLLAFSRKDTLVVAPMDIHTAIVNAHSLLEHSLDKNIAINRDFKAVQPIVDGDSVQVENAVINLCVNAAQAMDEGGVITISTDNVELDEIFCQGSPFAINPGNYVQIGIHDTGAGIPPDLLDRIFEPFFTTKALGKGTGLGLSAVYGTIKGHQGCISISSEVGVGTVFYLYLPVSSTVPHHFVEQENTLAQGSGCILIIDDEPVIRTTTAAILEQLGYRVVLAKDGPEGVETFKTHSDRIDLVLLDMIMPRMGGVTCAKALRAIDADVKILICSGFMKEESLFELQRLGITEFIKKPYRRAELARAVARAMAR